MRRLSFHIGLSGYKGKRHLSFLLLYLFTFLPVTAQYNIDRVLMAGRSALYYEDYVLSMQYFNQAINAKPYLYEPWFYRAIAKYNLDDFIGSEKDASQAILLNPYISTLYDLRGICRIRQEKYVEAAEDYDKAIVYDPVNSGLWYNRALCRIQGKDYQLAHQELDSMMVRWSTNAKIYQLKCEVCLQEKDTVQAARFLDKSLEIDPYDGEAWTVRAMMSMNKKKWKDADSQLSRAIHLKPTVVNNYINRALTRYNINNLRGALADYDKALELDPNNFMAHYNRGQLRVQVGDDNRAIEDFDFIIMMEPGNIMSIFNRALLLDRTGDLQGAIRDYSRVIDEFPNFWTGLQYRARCYRRLGMTAKAEMDEFRVFKAQQDKHLGVQPRWSKNKKKAVRKMSDIDPDKYNQLVEADEQSVDHEYATAYRGKVQNRKVDNEYMPMYMLTYSQSNNGVKSFFAYNEEVEHFNEKARPLHRLYVACNPKIMSEEVTRSYFALIDTLSTRIQNVKDVSINKSLLIQRAVAYAATQRFDDAINDLAAYSQIDSTLSIVPWQRAVCEAMMLEFITAQGIESDLKNVRALYDFDEAVRLNAENPYVFYDRGNLHASRRDYAKAIDDYGRAIALEPNLAEAYYNRGLARISAGHKNDGIADLSKAGELGLYSAYSILKKYRK